MTLDLYSAYKITFILLSIGLIIKGIEIIKISDNFKNGKPMNWEVVGLDIMQVSRFSFFYKTLYSKKGVIFLCINSIISIILIFVFNNPIVVNILGINLFITHLILHHRNEFGGDGADQMSFLIILTLFLCFIINNSYEVRNLGLIFIASQLLLSYFISGFAKLISKEWRTGIAVIGITSTFTYGTPYLKRLFHNYPFISTLICWYIILFETLFPLVLFLSYKYFIILIILGLLIHLFIGIFMGLNDFIWSFFAAYPALVYVYFNLI